MNQAIPGRPARARRRPSQPFGARRVRRPGARVRAARAVTPLALLGLWAGCAASGPVRTVAPTEIPALEATVRSDPADADARAQLAAAYLQSDRAPDAVSLLEQAGPAATGHPPTSFYLALAYEEVGRAADARRLYARFLEGDVPGALRRRVRARLVLLERRELEEAVRAALEREQSLGAPGPRTVGVFPFLSGAGETLRPLGLALAELLTTDLDQTGRLTVLERARVDLLLDEIQLGAAQVADPQSAARAGRLLGAGRIVQGRIDGTEADLRIQTVVVPVGSADPAPAPITRQGTLGDLFDLQTDLALSLYGAMGVQLTAAERERVTRRPTENVQALLAFGIGLEAEDAQRYAEAVGHYQRALQLDPAFVEARDAAERAQAKADAENDTADQLADAGLDLFSDLPLWLRRRARYAGVDEMIPSPGARDPFPEFLGIEGLRRRTIVDLIIRRPGGSQ